MSDLTEAVVVKYSILCIPALLKLRLTRQGQGKLIKNQLINVSGFKCRLTRRTTEYTFS